MAAGLACQAQALLVVDDLVAVGLRAVELRARQRDLTHRHLGPEAKPAVVDFLARAPLLALMGRHRDLGYFGRCCCGQPVKQRGLIGRGV